MEPQSANRNAQYDDEISLYDIYFTLLRRRWWFLGVVLLVIALSVTWALRQQAAYTPVYEAEAIVDLGILGPKDADRLHRTIGRLEQLHPDPARTGAAWIEEVDRAAGNVTIHARAQTPAEAETLARTKAHEIQAEREEQYARYREPREIRLAEIEQNINLIRTRLQQAIEQAAEENDDSVHQAALTLLDDSARLRLSELEERQYTIAEQLSSAADLRSPEILQPATAAEDPVDQPRIQLMIALGLMLGLMLGFFAAFLAEFIANAHQQKRNL